MLFNSNMLLVILESTNGKVLCFSVCVIKCAAEHIFSILDDCGVMRILCITLSCYFPYTCYFSSPFLLTLMLPDP
jgi:hypothetical protein